ncbi:hypothetical protein JCM15765_23580 [Paradesulfitobacterium aromaticivorans]
MKNRNFFLNACTVMNGTLAWDVSGHRDTSDCNDICPDTIYTTAKDISKENIA